MDRQIQRKPRASERGSGTGRPRRKERTSAGSYLRTVYLVLGSIVLLATAAGVFFSEIPVVERFAPNIATESMGILLVLVFVHRVLERQERAHRLRGSIGGLRKASRALERATMAWAELAKGCLARVPEPLPRDTSALLEPHYAEQIAHADPRRPRPDDGEVTWLRWTWREVSEACALLNQIIISYSASLDPAYVEAIDELVDDPFVRQFGELTAGPIDERQWRLRMNAARGLRETHFAHLAAAITLHNELAREAASVRTRRMAPRTGTIGMELPLDHDLRVDHELDRAWWSRRPAIGSLRAGAEAPATDLTAADS